MKEYTIKAGNHYSGLRFAPIWKPQGVSFTAMFTEESKYKSLPGTALREQWNKLGGISFDPFGRNSARVAWRYNCETDLFEIAAYFHIDGNFSAFQMSSVKVGEWINVECFRIQSKIGVIINDSHASMVANPLGLIGYHQFPYFGGQIAAPNDIKILIDWNIS